MAERGRRRPLLLFGLGRGRGSLSHSFLMLDLARLHPRLLGAVQDELLIVVHVAVEWLHRPVGGQPQAVGHQLHQRAVVGDQDDRPRIFVQRVQQGAAAVDVQVVGRFVEDQDVRRIHRHQVQQQARAFAARQGADGGLLFLERQAELGQARTTAALRGIGHGAADDLQRRVGRVHRLDLVLVEPAHAHLAVTVELARLDGQSLGDQLGEGRLARPIDAQQADAVVQVHPQIQVLQDRLARLIADIGLLQPDQRRGQGAFGRRQGEGCDALFGWQLDALHLLQPLDARLGLGGLGGLGLEAVDELLQVGALGVLLGLGRRHQAQFFGSRLFEGVVVAGVEVQLAVRQLQDVCADAVQQLAVVADDQGRVRIAFQPLLQPQGAFQVEVVGRFVQQQHVRFGEQGGRQCDAHPPPARELGHRAQDVIVAEAETGQDFRGAGGGAVGVDLDQAAPDLAHFFRLGGFQPGQQVVALDVGFQNGVQHADGRGGVFLIDRADARGLGQGDFVAVGGQFAQDQLEQGRLADAVAADQADLGARRQADGGVVQELAAPGVVGQVFDLQHGNRKEKGLRAGILERCAALAISRRPSNSQTRSHSHDRTYVLDHQAGRHPP